MADLKTEGERIAKVIARAGICSRRDAEKLIAEGRVKLDGAVVTTPAIKVTQANIVLVDGNPLQNISDIRKVSSVVANGRMYSSAKLWQSVGFRP